MTSEPLIRSVRGIWMNGLNTELLRKWRRSIDRTCDRSVRDAAEQAATELREWDGRTLPVHETVLKMARHEGVALEDVIAYLASLGIGYLVALSPREEDR